MRANLQGVGAGPALRGKLDLCTAKMGLLNRLRKLEVYFNQLNVYYENRKYFKDGRIFASDFEYYCRFRDGSKSV